MADRVRCPRQSGKQRRRRALVVALALLAASACSPIVANRGHFVEEERLAQLAPDRSTANDVLAALGTPTSVAAFDERTWYYIGQRTEQTAFFAPETVERRVLVIRFDEAGVVREMSELGLQDGLDVELVERETPTLGRRMTFLEQVIGNIGRFNNPQEN